MSSLPKGWAEAAIGNLLELKYGKSLPERVRSGRGFPVYGSNGVVGYHEAALTTGDTIVIGRKGSVGEVSLSTVPCTPIDTTYYVDGFSFGEVRYWYYQLKSLSLHELNKSTAIPGINRADVYALNVGLPPLPEQKRIADKLGAALARVDACRERLARVVPILKRFRQSVLAAATSGQLTADWREQQGYGHGVNYKKPLQGNTNAELKIQAPSNDAQPQPNPVSSEYSIAEFELKAWIQKRNEKKSPAAPDLTRWNLILPSEWAVASVNQFAECLDRLRVPIKRELRQSTHGHYPYYGANGEVSRIDEYIFDDELVLVTEDETFYGREKPIAYRSSGKCWVNNHAHVLRAAYKEANDYLCYSLMYYNVIPWLSGTTGRAKLTQLALNSLPIAIPPKIELMEIVRRVEALFAFADRLEARIASASAAAERLTPSLLAKAFRGELVPQDPNDEPASELLKRLAAQREATPKAKRTKKAATAVI